MIKEQNIPNPEESKESNKEQINFEDEKIISIVEKITGGFTNTEITSLPEFQEWCREEKIEPTKRAASKLRGLLAEHIKSSEEKKRLEAERIKEEKRLEAERIKEEKRLETIAKIKAALGGEQPFLVRARFTSYSSLINTNKDGISSNMEDETVNGYEMTLKDKKPKLLYVESRRDKGSYGVDISTNHVNQASPEILEDGFFIPKIYSNKKEFSEEQIDDIKRQLESELERLENIEN